MEQLELELGSLSFIVYWGVLYVYLIRAGSVFLSQPPPSVQWCCSGPDLNYLSFPLFKYRPVHSAGKTS